MIKRCQQQKTLIHLFIVNPVVLKIRVILPYWTDAEEYLLLQTLKGHLSQYTQNK